MEGLTFAQLLRNTLPGGVFLVAAIYVYPEWQKFFLQGNSERGVLQATVIIGLALLIGTLVQAVHRAVVYILVLRFIIYPPTHGVRDFIGRFWIFSVAPVELTNYEKRLAVPANEQEDIWLKGWADKTHFLWASAWATLLGWKLPGWFGFVASTEDFSALRNVFLVLFLAAVTDDWRFMQHQRQLLELEIPRYASWRLGLAFLLIVLIGVGAYLKCP